MDLEISRILRDFNGFHEIMKTDPMLTMHYLY